MWGAGREVLDCLPHAAVEADQAAAVHFSLIASCHRHGLDAFTYLRDVLTRLSLLGVAPSRDDLRLLLPDRWTKQYRLRPA